MNLMNKHVIQATSEAYVGKDGLSEDITSYQPAPSVYLALEFAGFVDRMWGVEIENNLAIAWMELLFSRKSFERPFARASEFEHDIARM